MIKLIGFAVIAAVISSTTAPTFAVAGEILSNISKTRSEISQTFARNTRG